MSWRVRCETGAAAPAADPPPAARAASRPIPEAPSAPTDASPCHDSGDSGQQGDDDEEHMLAEAGRDDSEAPRRDPEEVALELLQNELGARRIDNG